MNFTKRWVDLVVPKLRGGGMLVSYFDRDRINFLSHYLQSQYGFKCKGYFAFIKQNPVPQARKVKFMNGWEVAGMWQKPDGKLTFNYENGQQPDYIFCRFAAETKGRSTQHKNRSRQYILLSGISAIKTI